jgi:hypothetical protein
VRLSGSQRARPYQPRLSFQLDFNADQLFRGVHSGVTLDRSESVGYGQREHIYHHGMNHSGGLPTLYNDLFHIITPRREHTGAAEAEVTRYSDVYLDEQYENGSDGQVYEYELVYYPTTTVNNDPEGRKRPQPDTVAGTAIRHLSDNKEDYRWVFLNKNNRQQDDYSRLIEFTKVMALPSESFRQQIGSVIDVDQWLRAFAFGAITGHGDSYTSDGAQHNVQFFVRPSDNRVLQLPHDLDAFFDVNRALVGNPDLRKLISVAANEHMYYGHINDMMQTTFNQQYMQRWIDYWHALMPAQPFTSHLNDLVRRSAVLLNQIERAAPRVAFDISSGDSTVDTNTVTLIGDGWVDVRELRQAGSQAPLVVQWTDVTRWQVEVPVAQGTNSIVLEAYDFQGQRIASDSVTVTSTAANPVAQSLRISEINYNPLPPTEAELAVIADLNDDDFEFIELTNIGQQPINLLGVHFAAGFDFVFPSATLAAGQSAVVVRNQDAFRLRYGLAPSILGQVSDGRLDNAGELIQLAAADGTMILDFSYDDQLPWPLEADGSGSTLTLVHPSATPAAEFGNARRWAASLAQGGSPGQITPESDLDQNGTADVGDINFLMAGIRSDDEAFDLNGDGHLDSSDIVFFVEAVVRTEIGDANLDGLFNSTDLILVMAAGQYEDNLAGNSTWAEGDWDGDGDFGSGDVVLAFQRGGYVAAVRPMAAAAVDAAVAGLDLQLAAAARVASLIERRVSADDSATPSPLLEISGRPQSTQSTQRRRAAAAPQNSASDRLDPYSDAKTQDLQRGSFQSQQSAIVPDNFLRRGQRQIPG